MPNKFITSCIEAIDACDLELLKRVWLDLNAVDSNGAIAVDEEEYEEGEEADEEFQETILTYAIKAYQKHGKKQKELVLFLLQNGAEVDEPNAKGSYPMHVACEGNPDIEIITSISHKVAALAYKNQLDSNGNTALYYAVHFPKDFICAVISILLDCGISPDAGTISAKTEFQDLNPEYQYPEVAKLLGIGEELA